ncbi:hypothetical protein GF314_09350 [bacterium]|nr:hypothetical protein [bacterium]
MVARMTILILAIAWAAAVPAEEPAPPTSDAVRETVERLADTGRDAARAYAPFRRGAPAERERWSQLGELDDTVGEVATVASTLLRQARHMAGQPGFALDTTRREFRLRLSRADSLVERARAIEARQWDDSLPDEDVEARAVVLRRAREAKQTADRLVAAADDVAYAVHVTEGIGPRSLSLSVVGILVVFVVLTLTSLVVGGIRKLDDDWKLQEEAKAAAALEKEPSIDTTTLLLISAACATVITGRFRVRRVRRLLSPRQKRTPWSAQGRLILQGSHTVGRKT